MIKPAILLVSASALLALSACASDGSSPMPPMASNQCDASLYQQYIGKGREDLPAAPRGVSYRHLHKGGAATADYVTGRVNFVYDDQNRIESVRCG